MKQTTSDNSGYASQLKKSRSHLAKWTMLWLISTALATFGPLFIWADSKTLTALAILLNMLVGFAMIYAHKNHFQDMDEMQRKILLDAMALTLGVGLVVGLAYSLVETTNLLPIKAQISHLIILMGLTYIAANFISCKRYK